MNINEHSLKNEIKEKLEKGEISVTSGPINKDFKWTKEKEEEFEIAMKKVKELRTM